MAKSQFINEVTRTAQELTPLHLACFTGGLPLVKLLIDQGASYTKCNPQKIGMIHMAAQGDQGAVIYFLTRVLDLDVNA